MRDLALGADRPGSDPVRRRARMLLGSMLGTFVVVRVALHLSPNSDFNVGRYNVHHLFTGLLLIAAFGIPLALRADHGRSWTGDLLLLGFGVGLALALDEWVYLIATDGSNASYLLPVSLIGGIVMVGLAALYVVVLVRWRIGRAESRPGSDPAS